VIQRLQLQSFRSYQELILDIDQPFVVFAGPNGMGKTNILEAISLFTPGRGLRKAELVELQKHKTQVPWGASIMVSDYNLGTGISAVGLKKRIWLLNQEPLKSQKILNDILRLFWLTPETDRLFLDTPSVRRQFIDRMIFVLWPEHAAVLKAYEHATKERFRLLESQADAGWLSKVEEHVVDSGLKMQKNRSDFLNLLSFDESISAQMQGTAEVLVGDDSAKEIYLKQLFQNRLRDGASGMTLFGPHRSDLEVIFLHKNQSAQKCSTGEQKMLLSKLLIAFLKYLLEHVNNPVILLFDDVISHLDFANRVLLFEQLIRLQQRTDNKGTLQVFFTGTDLKAFEAILHYSQSFEVDNSQVRTVS
jgi:DNA replication and repair protein RecF